jgi:DNA-binding LacI/PurR family transcriptional regulator
VTSCVSRIVSCCPNKLLTSRNARRTTANGVVVPHPCHSAELSSTHRLCHQESAEDVAVVGFDDTPESSFYRPPLTTIRQDFAEVGRRSVDLLLRLLGGDEDVQRASIEPTLVVRASSVPPA